MIKILWCAAFLLGMLVNAPNLEARPQTLEQLAAITKHLLPVPLPGPITSLYRPNYDTVREAELKFSEREPVFIAMLPNGPHIYPQQYMLWHQVVNEVIDDHAYAITYCPITGTLMAYDATIQHINLIFDVEGHATEGRFYGFLYDGNSVLMDRNTGSLWLQETGMAFEGPMLGHGMAILPVFWTTWDYARKFFPNAKVLARPKGRRPYGRDPYGSYLREGTYYDNDVLMYEPRYLSRTFHRKTPILGIEAEGLLMAVDINYVKKERAVNFFMGPVPLLAVHDPRLDVIRIYNRQIWAEPFLFTYENGKLTDLATNSVWDPTTGKALSGNMAGSSMKEYFGVYSMWFAWYSINPETLYIPGPGEVSPKLLSRQKPGEGDTPDLPPPADQLPGKEKW